MVIIDDKINDAKFINAILKADDLPLLFKMYNEGYRITDIDHIQDILDTLFQSIGDINVIKFFINNVIEKTNGVLFVTRFRQQIDFDIISTMINKGIIFKDDLIYSIIVDKQYSNYRKHIPYIIIKCPYVAEYIEQLLINFIENYITLEQIKFIRFCSTYFNDLISDQLIMKISIIEILQYGRIRTFRPKSISVSEEYVEKLFDEIVKLGNIKCTSDPHKLVELSLLVQKNTHTTYKTIKEILTYAYDEIIFEIFPDILKDNLQDVFSTIIICHGEKINRKLIEWFYTVRPYGTVLSNIHTIINLSKILSLKIITIDDIVFVYNKEESIKQEMLSNSKKVFKNVHFTLPMIKFLSDIYSPEIVYKYMIQILFIGLRFVDKDTHTQILEFLMKKYPNFLSLYTLDKIIETISNKNIIDKQFTNFLDTNIKNFRQSVTISEENFIVLVDKQLFDTIDILIDYRVINPKNYIIENILHFISKKCEEFYKMYRMCKSSSSRTIFVGKCSRLLNVCKFIASNYSVNEWTEMCKNIKLSQLFQSIYKTSSNVHNIASTYILS